MPDPRDQQPPVPHPHAAAVTSPDERPVMTSPACTRCWRKPRTHAGGGDAGSPRYSCWRWRQRTCRPGQRASGRSGTRRRTCRSGCRPGSAGSRTPLRARQDVHQLIRLQTLLGASRSCRNEGVVVAHIYPRIGILTHALPALWGARRGVFSIVLIGNQTLNICG